MTVVLTAGEIYGFPIRYRSRNFAALCEQPNVHLPSANVLVGETALGRWELPDEMLTWLEENVGPQSDTPQFTDGGKWNWAIHEIFSGPISEKMTDRFTAHFVFADQKNAALFKIMWG